MERPLTKTRNTWETKCTCSGVTLSGLVKYFIHSINCPLRKFGVKKWG